ENTKVNQADIDALFNQNNKKAEEPKKAETKKVNQNDIDALFNANKKTETAKPVKIENTKVNQADIDALFNQNNIKTEEPKKAKTTKVNQNDIDALFNANNKTEVANPSKNANSKVNQADIDALFNQNNRKEKEISKSSHLELDEIEDIKSSWIDPSAPIKPKVKKEETNKTIPNISFVEKESINTEISRIFSEKDLKDINVPEEEVESDHVFSDDEISNLLSSLDKSYNIEEMELENFKVKEIKEKNIKIGNLEEDPVSNDPTLDIMKEVYALLDNGKTPYEISQMLKIPIEDAELYFRIKEGEI
ncbi:MAG: hypothetical protein JXR48_05340, partial [Candidatus Delongbacteria bacterium]|nr:hypothetical protein [Candidatus Delongbacteria bacterium]MBN2834373.1 hypothetical protein [Candidatus Delongbacteria bacterium]